MTLHKNNISNIQAKVFLTFGNRQLYSVLNIEVNVVHMVNFSLLHKASTMRPATDCLSMRKIIEQFSHKVSYRQRIQIQSHTEL